MYLKLLKYSAYPPNIVFPIPIVPIFIGLYGESLSAIWKPVFFTFLFYPIVNLWNHLNDAEDDFKAGKDTPFVFREIRRVTWFLIAILAIISFLFIYLNGHIIGLFFYLIVLILTFLYSDNTLTKIRLKKHYLGEIIVYIISIPAGVFMLYSIVKNPDLEALKVAILLTPLMMSTVLIKDLKDISGDRNAGLKTLGVVFSHESLVKVSSIMFITYFVIGILLFSSNKIYIVPFVIPFFGLIIGLLSLKRHNWTISIHTIKYYNILVFSSLLSFVILTTLKFAFIIMKF